VNLIAARQLALFKFKSPASNAGEIAESYKNRASIVMQTLERHSKVFTASEVGRSLLDQITTEISGGQMTMEFIREQILEDDPNVAIQNPNQGLFQHVVKDGMSKTTATVLNEPGKCAGTMLQPEGLGH
jgi:hypothetical protein